MLASPSAAAARPRLYREIAAEIRRLIESGTFRPGDRVPSVRELARQRNVSVTTVLEAYRLLEDDGYIEARPQSGTFVRARLMRIPEEPRASSPPPNPRSVSTGQMMTMLLRDSDDRRLVPLGAAFPPAELMPSAKLNRAFGRIARRRPDRIVSAPEGSRELRAQIARRGLASGCSLTPDDIVVTNGCQEAITFALRAVCEPGDTVAVESPTFYGFLQACDLLGLRVLEIATYPRHGLCLDSVRRAIRRHPVRAFVLMPNFSNPVGSCMPDEKKKELVSILERREIPLIEDDIAGDLAHGPARPKAAKAFDRKGLVLLCSSFSKTLAPGYRVGWIAPGRFRDRIVHHKAVTNFYTAVLPQLAIADFLSNGGYDRHLRRLRRLLAHNVAMMTECVGASFPEGTRVSRPAGGFLLWVELPRGADAMRLYERAREARIAFAPGPLFSAKGAFRNFIRLNGARWSEKIRQAVVTLGRLASG